MENNSPLDSRTRARSITAIAAALIIAVGMGYGLSLVGSGFASRTGNSITVTGSAKTSATADNAVWVLNVQESSPKVSSAVTKVESSVTALTNYLTKGGVDAATIETGGINTYATQEYNNGNPTGRVLSYSANQNVTVRSKDVAMIKSLSNGIGALLQTGVNVNNYGPQYYVSNLASLRPKLLADAMVDAKLRGTSITKAVGSSLGPVLSVTSGPVQVTTPDSVDASAGGMYDTSSIDKTRLGVVVASGIGGVITLLDQYDVLKTKGARSVSPHTVPMLMPNGPAANVGLELQAKAGVHTPVSACASGAEAVGYALEMIRNNRADIIVTGGVEAAIHQLPMAGFASMKALSTRNDAPEKASRPYDKDRDGFVLGEGGGILLLEELEHAKARGAKIYAEVVGQGLTSDGYHIAAPDPEGAGVTRAVKFALEDSGVKLSEVVHLNAHATSTPAGDVAEANALAAALGADISHVAVSATKSMTGHLLGGAGAIESIFCVLALHHRMAPPTINIENLDEAVTVDVVRDVARKLPDGPIAALNDSFGFGGHNVVLVFRSYEGA